MAKLQRPHESMFENQLQFNLNVPLTTYNMATHFHNPRPITIERGAPIAAGQGFPMAQLVNKQPGEPISQSLRVEMVESSHDFNFSVLSQDRMAAAVQLAQRDLKNQKLQQKAKQGDNRHRSPSPSNRQRESSAIPGTRFWHGHKSRVPKKSLSASAAVRSQRGGRMRVREHDRNRNPRSSSSQTPPASPPRPAPFLSTKVTTECGDNLPTRDTPSATRVACIPSDDIEKLQLEMELCLQQIESVQRRALSEHNTDFLRRNTLRNQLVDEEGEERQQVRASEQSHRDLRTIYNLQQQVKVMEQQLGKGPVRTKGTKKSQALLRLAMVNKGAVRLLQTFVNQLPQQDLRHGLPPHFRDLTDLVRQVTLLSAGASAEGGKVKDGKNVTMSPIEKDVIAMVEQVERLNKNWQKDLVNREAIPVSGKEKPPFVTNFRNENSAFTKERVSRPPLQHKSSGQDVWYSERKAVLQAGIQALLKAKQRKKAPRVRQSLMRPYSAQLAQPPPPQAKGLSCKLPTRKPPPTRKGFLRAYQVNQPKPPKQWGGGQILTHFADPTITANLKASTLLHNPLTGSASPVVERKKVNFAVDSPPHSSPMHASYPGTTSSRQHHRHHHLHPSSSSRQRRNRSHSPKGPGRHSSADSSLYYNSDSDSAALVDFHSADELSSIPFSSVESLTSAHRRPRSYSPRSRGRRKDRNPPLPQRRFLVSEVDDEQVRDLCRNDSMTSGQGGDASFGDEFFPPKNGSADLSPYLLQEVERRMRERLKPTLKKHSASAKTTHDYDCEDDFDIVANTIMDEVVNEVAEEYSMREQQGAAAEMAAGMVDNPTLENILHALEKMEKDNEQLRHKYSSITYHDSAPPKRYQNFSQVYAECRSEQPRTPPALEVTNLNAASQDTLALPRAFGEELSHEPLIFTKDSKAYRSNLKMRERGEGYEDLNTPSPETLIAQKPAPQAVRPKKLLSLKQTVVEQIEDCVERFDYYQRGLKHHLGKKNYFKLYESVADEILKSCCEEVAAELEHINSDMAENIYTSEFMDETGMPLAPPELAQDFETEGTAAKNLRDSAAAQRSVEAAVSRAVTSLMLPLDEPEIPILSPKPIAETPGDTSPPWDTSLKHVYDATALYEASVTEKPPAESSLARSGKVKVKDDDTQLEEEEENYDYDDDYTDISDDEEDEVTDDDDDDDDESRNP